MSFNLSVFSGACRQCGLKIDDLKRAFCSMACQEAYNKEIDMINKSELSDEGKHEKKMQFMSRFAPRPEPFFLGYF